MTAKLEHANYTVSNVQKTAGWMSELFGWHIRWQGPSLDEGYSLHIGTGEQYLALYQPKEITAPRTSSYRTKGGLNHIAVVVDDIDRVETNVIKLGFTPENHASYEPGRRFYFHDGDGIEYEVVEYD